jgi:hypothetical protein
MRSISATDEEKTVMPIGRRRLFLNLVGLSLLQPLAACGKSGILMKKEITFTVVMYSFLDRPIFEIILNDSDIGAANSYGTTSMVTGIKVPMGEQKLNWTLGGPEGMPRNDEVVKLKNKVVINPSDIPSGSYYMGVYLYPDDTAEFTFTEFMPGQKNTIRGNEIMKKLGKK